jgi:hypothetical protein
MSIKLELGATYDGMELDEVYKIIRSMKELGLSDEMINEALERSKDK